MPLYEYQCNDCGSQFEKLVRGASQRPEVACPTCGESHVTQQYSTFAPRANGMAREAAPSCPSGRCATPGLCGRN
jgi:putative FmdB family regulatory protein